MPSLVYSDLNRVLTPQDADIDWALQTLAARRSRYQLYRDYYRGEHDLPFVSPEYRVMFRALLADLRANICPRVVFAVTDRLEVQSFKGSDAATQQWNERNMADMAGRLHDTAVSMGDAYLIVWPDINGLPRYYVNDGLSVCHEHDEEREEIITRAAKLWPDGKRWRINLYYADRIEKYRTTRDDTGVPRSSRAFAPYAPDGEAWPLPNDYGAVPVVHFPFAADTHDIGVSILRDVIPIQRALNKSLVDLAVAGEYLAWGQRVFIGIEAPPEDERLRAAMDRVLTIDDPNAKIAEFTAVNLENFTKTMVTHCSQIAMIAGIPPHYFFLTGDFPSGESLKTAESSLVKRVEKTQRTFGSSWADVMRLALRIQAGADAQIQTVWASAETRDETAQVNRLSIAVRDLGVTKAQALRELGYTDTQITQMETERATETTTVTDAFGSLFDRGVAA